jgi:hypothetical protein
MFFVPWQNIMKEIGKIISKMEENLNSPMRTLQSLVD